MFNPYNQLARCHNYIGLWSGCKQSKCNAMILPMIANIAKSIVHCAMLIVLRSMCYAYYALRLCVFRHFYGFWTKKFLDIDQSRKPPTFESEHKNNIVKSWYLQRHKFNTTPQIKSLIFLATVYYLEWIEPELWNKYIIGDYQQF